MSATDHLKNYGVTPRLKENGKIGLQGVGSLPENVKDELITWAKNNRAEILQELNPDLLNVLTEKGNPDPPPIKKRRQKIRLVTPAMVAPWRVGRKWILSHLPELEAAGWTRQELMRAGRFRYPCGTWGPAFTGPWLKAGVKVTIEPGGALSWSWANAMGGAVTQRIGPKKTRDQNDPQQSTPDGWTQSELERNADAEAGKAVVANIRTDKALVEWAKKNKRYVYIGRGSKWGNPHRIGVDGDRATVCLKHAEGFERFHEVDELKGKVLGCYCYPEQCHGDFLAWWANGPTETHTPNGKGTELCSRSH